MAGDRRRAPLVTTGAGVVQGRWHGPVAAFHGVPYAAPPVGAARFAPPHPAASWPGIRDATTPGPVAPQPPAARLERVLGPMRGGGEQGEDCLSVNVWTPEPGGTPRPVLVWLHGGGFASGSASADWYAGHRLAERGDIVVVAVNYRLGALGYLYLADLADDMGAGNQGLLDMIAALRWVRANIAAFGGDPDQVTLAGQSGGALSAAAIMTDPDAALFRRVILQSGPLSIRPMPVADAAQVTELFLNALDVPAHQVHRLREVPVSQLLAAQHDVVRATLRPLDLTPPFQLVADGRVVPADPVALVGAGEGSGIDVMIGCNRDEASAFFAANEQVERMSRQDVVNAIRPWSGDAADHEVASHEPGAPAAVAAAVVNDHVFFRPQHAFVAARAANGSPAFAYRFDWRPAGRPFGACHCLELPFVFGNPQAWQEAPMLPETGERLPAALVDAVQSAWISFVRSGDPSHPGLPDWAASSATSPFVQHIDADPRDREGDE